MSSKKFYERFWHESSQIDKPDNNIRNKYGESERETEKRLENIFKKLDRNGNGRIDIQELTASLKDLGMAHQYAEVILMGMLVCLWSHCCPFLFIQKIQIIFTESVFFFFFLVFV